MDKIFTFTLFVIYCYGLGAYITLFLKKYSLENIIFRIGCGLGMIPVLGVVLNALHVPLDWKIFFFLSIIGLTLSVLLHRPAFKFSFKRPSIHTILLILIFAACVFVYCKGPFQYPWLEDDDSWGHAAGMKYIAIEKSINVPSGIFPYINPYPPGYDILFGILHQTSSSLYWTMKFFNGFIVSLGFLFFFIFSNELLKDKSRAVTATFYLAAIPCYLTHFIWAHALAVTLFLPAFYAGLKSIKSQKYILPGIILCCGILFTQQTQSIKFVIMFVLMWFAISTGFNKLNKTIILILCGAALTSLLWYGPVLKEIAADKSVIALRGTRTLTGNKQSSLTTLKGIFNPNIGTATRPYRFKDYFYIPDRNLINNPTSMGATLFILSLFGLFRFIYLLLKGAPSKKVMTSIVLLWLSFTFLGMNSATFDLPIGLFAFRFWMLFAIPACILAAETTLYIFDTLHRRPILKYLTLLLLFSGVIKTAGLPKYGLNTNLWQYGIVWHSYSEMMSYAWLRHNLPVNTKVFAFTENLFVIGNDMRADFWSKEYKSDFQNAFELNLTDLYDRLKKQGFEYIIVGGRETQKFGNQAVQSKVLEMKASGKFRFVFGIKNGALLFKIA